MLTGHFDKRRSTNHTDAEVRVFERTPELHAGFDRGERCCRDLADAVLFTGVARLTAIDSPCRRDGDSATAGRHVNGSMTPTPTRSASRATSSTRRSGDGPSEQNVLLPSPASASSRRPCVATARNPRRRRGRRLRLLRMEARSFSPREIPSGVFCGARHASLSGKSSAAWFAWRATGFPGLSSTTCTGVRVPPRSARTRNGASWSDAAFAFAVSASPVNSGVCADPANIHWIGRVEAVGGHTFRLHGGGPGFVVREYLYDADSGALRLDREWVDDERRLRTEISRDSRIVVVDRTGRAARSTSRPCKRKPDENMIVR